MVSMTRRLDQAPVVAITGQTYSDLKGSHFQQEVNMLRLFDDVAVYNEEVINPNQIEMLANEACRHALNHRGVAHITFPVDYQEVAPSGKTSMHKVKARPVGHGARSLVGSAGGRPSATRPRY